MLFPVYANTASIPPGPPLDPVFAEAIAYDDGFAKIVHARQPQTSDVIAENDTPGLPPATELGVQIAWDDEDLLISQNRTVGLEADGSTPPDAPRAVSGYRIDVREFVEPPGAADAWTSLCRIRGVGVGFNGTTFPTFETELKVEVTPTKATTQFWLPPYYVNWRGGSVVVQSPDQQVVSGRPAEATTPFSALDADSVPLRYGHTYELRVRLSDPTGGGPEAGESPSNPAPSPISEVVGPAFRPARPPEVGRPDRDTTLQCANQASLDRLASRRAGRDSQCHRKARYHGARGRGRQLDGGGRAP